MLRTNVSPRQLVAALVVVAGVALSAPAGAWAGEPDQSQTAPPNGAVMISGQGWAEQTFTVQFRHDAGPPPGAPTGRAP